MGGLKEARDPFGGPRFYPPGQHPAGRPYREALERLDAIRGKTAETPAMCETVAYYEERLAEIEAGEHRAKDAYIRDCDPAPSWPSDKKEER